MSPTRPITNLVTENIEHLSNTTDTNNLTTNIKNSLDEVANAKSFDYLKAAKIFLIIWMIGFCCELIYLNYKLLFSKNTSRRDKENRNFDDARELEIL